MAKRNTELPEVPLEEYGVRVLVRLRPDQPEGNLELVGYIPTPNGKGSTAYRRVRRSARTKDAKKAYRNAKKFAKRLAERLGISPASRLKMKFFGGEDVTVLDCLEYYEANVIPQLREPEYEAYARTRCKVLRKLVPLVATSGGDTALRLIDQRWVDRFADIRLEKGGLKKDGSGEWSEPDDAMDESERRVSLTTVRKDLEFLHRAIVAAGSHQVKDEDGKWVRAVQYDPFEDGSKRIQLPQDQDVVRQPIMSYETHRRMVAAAGVFDEQCNQEYERLGYPGRFPHFSPRCPHYTEALLQIARQGRRRGAIAGVQWQDIVFPEEGERMAEAIGKTLRIKVTAVEATRVFPHGLIVWQRKTDKRSTWRFAPMPAYLERLLRAFKRNHPNREDPRGPLFYRIQDHRRPVRAGTLAEWFPRIQARAGIDHFREEGWHEWRRLFRQERHGHFSNKVVAYCGGWSRLNAIDKILDVDETQAMNRHYLQVLLRQMYACMAFDGSQIDEEVHIPGVSQYVLAQMRADGYLKAEDGPEEFEVDPKSR